MRPALYMLIIHDADTRLSVYLMDELRVEFVEAAGSGACRAVLDHFRTLRGDPSAQYAYVDGLLHGCALEPKP